MSKYQDENIQGNKQTTNNGQKTQYNQFYNTTVYEEFIALLRGKCYFRQIN